MAGLQWRLWGCKVRIAGRRMVARQLSIAILYWRAMVDERLLPHFGFASNRNPNAQPHAKLNAQQHVNAHKYALAEQYAFAQSDRTTLSCSAKPLSNPGYRQPDDRRPRLQQRHCFSRAQYWSFCCALRLAR